MIAAERDDRQFRRGVVLGLTMAEILLLLIFLLMLLMVAKLQEGQAAMAAAEVSRDIAVAQVSDLEVVIEDLRHRSDGVEFDITREYRVLADGYDAAVAKLDALAPLIQQMEQDGAAPGFDIFDEFARLQQELSRLKPAESLLADALAAAPDASPEDAVQLMSEAARIGNELIEQAQEILPGAGPGEAIEEYRSMAETGDQLRRSGGDAGELAESAARCTRELRNCEGQTVHLTNRLNTQTGGRDKKPCWVDAEGRIQYIFDAHLRSDGVVVIDNKLPDRADEQDGLPLAGVHFGTPLPRSTFGAAFTPLLRWSDEKDCRFYVRLVDETDINDKSSYKDTRRTVEGYFYILDVK